MCGIAGIILNDRLVEKQDLQRMLPGINHRGPDGKGSFIHENVGLLHKRLSIIDTSEAANQPLFNESKSLALICNGEIYNYTELRKELIKLGHSFSCNSDSEVLLHLYEEHKGQPSKMLNKLKGMFAFAIYDIPNKVLFLARDRFGIKPLYYAKNNSDFYFASEITSIVDALDGRVQLDYTSLFEYYQYLSIPEPNTIYRSIKTLPSGHFAVVRDDELEISKWYGLEDINGPYNGTLSTYNAELRETIDKSVVRHLVADVPVGSFLSAGIDSTLVSHLSSKYVNLTTISAGFPGEPEDESTTAANTALKMGVPHYTCLLKGGFMNDYKPIVNRFDQPFAVASAFSLYRIASLAKKHMKVVLTGDGGDEVFAGYDHKHKPFYKPAFVENTPKSFFPIVGKVLGSLPSQKANRIGRYYTLSKTDRFLNRSRILGEEDALSLIPHLHRNEVDRFRLSRQIDQLFIYSETFSWLHQLLFVDVNTFLKSEMLYKVDRMTMANQIEGRVPFLDHHVVELAFQAQPQWLRDDHHGKLPLRNWIDELYPELGKRPKTGFNAPLVSILREEPSTRDTISRLIEVTTTSSFSEPVGVKKLLKRFEEGDNSLNSMVMAMSCLGGWLEKR